MLGHSLIYDRFMTYDEALAHVHEVLAILDGLAEEEWIAESFIPEALIQDEGENGYSVAISGIYYTLEEMGERQLSLDLEEKLTL